MEILGLEINRNYGFHFHNIDRNVPGYDLLPQVAT